MVKYFQAPWVVELTESPEEPLPYDEPRPRPGPVSHGGHDGSTARPRPRPPPPGGSAVPGPRGRQGPGLQHQQATELDRAEPVAVTSNQIAVPPAPMGWASWNTFDR